MLELILILLSGISCGCSGYQAVFGFLGLVYLYMRSWMNVRILNHDEDLG